MNLGQRLAEITCGMLFLMSAAVVVLVAQAFYDVRTTTESVPGESIYQAKAGIRPSEKQRRNRKLRLSREPDINALIERHWAVVGGLTRPAAVNICLQGVDQTQ